MFNLFVLQQVSFPSDHGGPNGRATFSFSVSSTQDMEGPGGSFECVRQCATGGRGSAPALESLGPMQHKVRIHANDDVYEATRHRMTVAEENHKNKRLVYYNLNIQAFLISAMRFLAFEYCCQTWVLELESDYSDTRNSYLP